MSSEHVSTQSREVLTESLDPSRVEAFLREHPAFFKHRPELLTSLDLPHGGEGAVSLVERQVNILRERNIEMRNRLKVMGQNAEINDSLFNATRGMVLSLLECRAATLLADVVESGLRDRYGVEFSALLWLDTAGDAVGNVPLTEAERASVAEGLLKRRHAFCGVFRADEMAALFPDCQGEGSAAIAPLLWNEQLIGAIAVGSSDVRRYDGDMGTLFLEHLTEVIVRLPFVQTPSDP